ncbi:MAG TPA: hypothetical protein DIW47_10265 [Bacteroidetes bacterium]|nr:hypothetical protein [Bacteroidota bacterium]
MTKEGAIKIIDDNAASENNSYMDFMHEKNLFDEYSFWKFYNSIRLLGHEFRIGDSLPRELTSKILKSYEWHLLLIGFHFDEKDGCSIENLPPDYSQYSLRLRNAVNAFIDGNPISDELEGFLNEVLENKLKNDCPKFP